MKKSTVGQILAGLQIASMSVCAFALIGCGGGDSAAGDKSSTPKLGGKKSDDGTGDSTDSAAAGSGGSRSTAPSGAGGTGSLAGLAGANQAPAVVASSKPKVTTPPPGARRDPFRPWFDTTPPPPAIMTFVTPTRLAADDTADKEAQPGIEIQEVANRRVAGILTGNGIYALLDTNGDQKVVKPGDLLDDGYRVVMITSNAVTLKKTVNTQTFTQVVLLSDAGSAQTASFAPRSGGVTGPGRGGLMGGPGRGAKGNGGGLE